LPYEIKSVDELLDFNEFTTEISENVSAPSQRFIEDLPVK